jgi:tetratricopeptide (TPR) repeat protein
MLAAMAALWMPGAALAATADDTSEGPDRYTACIAKAEENPEEAFEDALAWRDQGGGGAAEHCSAMALIGLGYASEAAMRLDMLARDANSGTPGERAEILLQSGEAWLVARRAELAREAFSAALMLAPRNARIWSARARAHAADDRWDAAEEDLDAAITFETIEPEYYVLRAGTRKELGKTALAREDLENALRIDPDYPDALAERGMMKFESGDENGAREDWIRVLNLAPESEAADIARFGIERMEVTVEP